MRVLVCGGRGYRDRKTLFGVLDRIHFEECISEIIEGGADGADRMGRMWALKNGVYHRTFEAPWDDIESAGCIAAKDKNGRIYNKNAGTIRNRQMLIEGRPNLVVAFPGGWGTLNMMKQTVEVGCTLLKI